MPPPPSPSTSGSSVLGKRKRPPRDGSSQCAMDSPLVPRGPTSFSESTKDLIEEANGGEFCWCCNAGVIQFCHIIPRGSRKVYPLLRPSHRLFVSDRWQMLTALRRRGLLSIDTVHTPANGMALCPTCHILFDSHEFPGWVFLPLDLQYFIDFEQQDFERREKLFNEAGEWPIRAVPSAQNYLQQQAVLLPREAVGGLYRRLFFHSRYSSNGVEIVGENAEFPPRPWHGCPLAALHRVFQSLGPQSHLFPDDIKKQLRDLKDLYGHHDRLAGVIPMATARSKKGPVAVPAAASTSLPQVFYNTSDNMDGYANEAYLGAFQQTGQSGKQNTVQGLNPSRKRARSDSSSRSSQYESPDARYVRRKIMRSASDKHMPWVWGPNASSEEKIKFYRGVYSIGKKSEASDGVQEEDEFTRAGNEAGERTPDVATNGVEPKVKCEQEETKVLLPSPQASAG
ncbi:MAG: hypothetical protein Q9225_007865 [Loekoesia sp. 1 TL-2023]